MARRFGLLNTMVLILAAGLSLLPLSAYGRAFTDLLGTLNRRLTAERRRSPAGDGRHPAAAHGREDGVKA